jgi:hypothetical protein
MSSNPSPSKSKTAAPEPTICGMKCFDSPTGPASWMKSSPTLSVTSSNQGGERASGASEEAPPQPGSKALTIRVVRLKYAPNSHAEVIEVFRMLMR